MHVVSDECVKCGACEATCPTGAITEGETKYVVGDACIDCGACEAVCPKNEKIANIARLNREFIKAKFAD